MTVAALNPRSGGFPLLCRAPPPKADCQGLDGDAMIGVRFPYSRGKLRLALVEGCKHSLEISVPVEEVESETGKVVSSFQAKAKLPGFRPGKAPASLIRKQFQVDIRQKVLENLIPRHLEKRVKEEDLHLAGRPGITKS